MYRLVVNYPLHFQAGSMDASEKSNQVNHGRDLVFESRPNDRY